MATDVLKNFRLRCALIEKTTGKNLGVKEIIIQGYYGNEAVIRFRNKLDQEGKFTLDDDYSYFEIGPVQNSNN